MEIKQYVTAALLIGLFAIALITFTIEFSGENELNSTSTDNPAVEKAFKNLSRTVNNSLTEANEIRESFASESKNPILQAVELVFRSILFAGQTLISLVAGIFNTIGTLAIEVFNVSPLVINVILAILVIGLVLAGWALYKIGK